MLVLTRRVGERIFIGEDIVLQITKIVNGQTSIGIVAPDDVPILREEVLIRNKINSQLQDALKNKNRVVAHTVGKTTMLLDENGNPAIVDLEDDDE
jgi:carbon storage regulator